MTADAIHKLSLWHSEHPGSHVVLPSMRLLVLPRQSLTASLILASGPLPLTYGFCEPASAHTTWANLEQSIIQALGGSSYLWDMDIGRVGRSPQVKCLSTLLQSMYPRATHVTEMPVQSCLLRTSSQPTRWQRQAIEVGACWVRRYPLSYSHRSYRMDMRAWMESMFGSTTTSRPPILSIEDKLRLAKSLPPSARPVYPPATWSQPLIPN